MSLVLALAASAQELPLVEQQGWRCSSEAEVGTCSSASSLCTEVLPLALCNLKFREGKEKARDKPLATDENSQSSLEKRSRNRTGV